MFGLKVDELERPPGYIIVGHVTDSSAIIWAKGSPRYARVKVTLKAEGSATTDIQVSPRTVVLDDRNDNIAVATFKGLPADADYIVTAVFKSPMGFDKSADECRMVHASFRTAPDPDGQGECKFSFLLGSCNLSIVSINNLAARALQIIGVYAARQSLRRPIDEDKPLPRPAESRWTKIGRWWMQSPCRRWLTDWALKLGVGAVFVGTGGKWPSQPLLRSPFLKLEALFAGEAVQFAGGHRQPVPGDIIQGSLSGARGVLAFAPKLGDGHWRKKKDERSAEDEKSGEPKHRKMAEGSLILLDVEKTFEPSERLFVASGDGEAYGPTDLGTVGYVIDTAEVKSAYEKPRFTIHAGDQIYFDFPDTKRPPELGRYHEAYREAWFEDRYQRSFFARGAHYMMLDDHEIVDQYSVDRATPDKVPDGYPKENFSQTNYEEASLKAYEHYVRLRHADDKKKFEFDYARARFFLLDTRTQRRRSPDTTLQAKNPNTRMIGKDQMEAFRKWLLDDGEDGRKKLKFVVSSVPFIAEILPERGDEDGERRIDRSDDKWSGAAFRRQREEIIELINKHRIENVVFLVGDMHCAYHASMTVGKGYRWERHRVHELAGGPINQLQHGRRRQFAPAVRGETRGKKTPYDIRLHQFHSGANAVMHIEVEHAPGQAPSIHWRVIRTMTEFDGGPCFDGDHETAGRVDDEPPIAGRIMLSSNDRTVDRGAE